MLAASTLAGGEGATPLLAEDIEYLSGTSWKGGMEFAFVLAPPARECDFVGSEPEALII
jgi:hypothetical protein